MSYSLEGYNRYKYIVENIKDIIWEVDTNIVFTFVSPASKESIGYEPEELIGRSLLDFLSKASAEHILNQFKQNIQKRIETGSEKIVLYNVEFITKENKTAYFEVSVKPVFKHKNLVGYIGSSRDISEKKVYENEVKKYIEELKHANNKLEELANFDMLTEAYNRRKFENYAKLSIDKKVRYGCPFSIIMFDVDNFKKVNDSYGHKKGDQTLQKMSEIVRHIVRETDKLFRWGGDEFTILLQETILENACKVAEKIRAFIETKNFDVESGKVTVSLGVGEYKLGESPDQFILRVDNALLRAKTNGRNKIELG